MQRAVPRQRSGPRTVSPVWARLRAFAALLRAGQSPRPNQGVKRGVGPFVGRLCGAAGSRPCESRFRPPERPMQAGIGGQSSRSIFLLDKGGWSLCAHPPANTAPQRGSGIRRRWSVSGLFAVAGGRNMKKHAANRLYSHIPQVAVSGGRGHFWR